MEESLKVSSLSSGEQEKIANVETEINSLDTRIKDLKTKITTEKEGRLKPKEGIIAKSISLITKPTNLIKKYVQGDYLENLSEELESAKKERMQLLHQKFMITHPQMSTIDRFNRITETIIHNVISQEKDERIKVREEKNILQMVKLLDNVNLQDKNGNTLLHLACLANMPNLISTLLEMGADLNQKNSEGTIPLIYAFQSGGECAKILLNHPDINLPESLPKDKIGNTFLHYACKNGDNDVFKKYIEKDLSPLFEKNMFNETPFSYILKSGNRQLISDLLKALDKSDIDKSVIIEEFSNLDKSLKDSLLLQSVHPDPSVDKIAVLLIESGASCNERSEDPAVEGATAFLITLSNPKMVNTLKAIQDTNSANLDITVGDLNAIHFACLGGNENAFDWLLDQNLDIRTVGDQGRFNGMNILMCAAEGGNQNIVNKLLKIFPNVILDARDDNGLTAFDHAVMFKHTAIATQLLTLTLNYLVDSYTSPYLEEEPHKSRIVNRSLKELSVFLKGVENTIVTNQIERQDISEVLGSLKQDKKDLLLLVVCREGLNTDNIATILVEKGASCNIPDPEKKTTAFMMALSNPKMVKLRGAILQKECADINMKAEGLNSLHFAAIGGDDVWFKKLLDQNLDVTAVGSQGINILMCAAQGGNRKIFNTLMELIPDRISLSSLVEEDKSGKTVFDYAVRTGNLNIAVHIIGKNFEALIDSYNDPSLTIPQKKQYLGRISKLLQNLDESVDTSLMEKSAVVKELHGLEQNSRNLLLSLAADLRCDTIAAALVDSGASCVTNEQSDTLIDALSDPKMEQLSKKVLDKKCIDPHLVAEKLTPLYFSKLKSLTESYNTPGYTTKAKSETFKKMIPLLKTLDETLQRDDIDKQAIIKEFGKLEQNTKDLLLLVSVHKDANASAVASALLKNDASCDNAFFCPDCIVEEISPFMMALSNPKMEMLCDQMLDRADINKTVEGLNALHFACLSGSHTMFTKILPKNININVIGDQGKSKGMNMLMCAAIGGNEETFSYLLSKLPDEFVTQEDHNNLTAFEHAILAGNLNIATTLVGKNIKMLINKYNSESLSGKEKRTLLEKVSSILKTVNGSLESAKIDRQLLMEEVGKLDPSTKNLLLLLAVHPDLSGNAVASVLLESGASYNEKSSIQNYPVKGATALMMTLSNNKMKELSETILKDGNIDLEVTAEGLDYLHFACIGGDDELFEEFLKLRQDTSTVGDTGQNKGANILISAAKGGNPKIANKLTEILPKQLLYSFVVAKDMQGLTALEHAIKNNHPEVAVALFESNLNALLEGYNNPDISPEIKAQFLGKISKLLKTGESLLNKANVDSSAVTNSFKSLDQNSKDLLFKVAANSNFLAEKVSEILRENGAQFVQPKEKADQEVINTLLETLQETFIKEDNKKIPLLEYGGRKIDKTNLTDLLEILDNVLDSPHIDTSDLKTKLGSLDQGTKDLLLLNSVRSNLYLEKVATFLLENGASCNHRHHGEVEGETAFMMILSNPKLSKLSRLILKNDLANTKLTKDGLNALHFAAKGGNIEWFTKLLNEGLDVSATGTQGENKKLTVLMWAAYGGNKMIVDSILKVLPKELITERDGNGLTAFDHAIKGGRFELARDLAGEGVDFSSTVENLNYYIHRSNETGSSIIKGKLLKIVKDKPELLNVQDSLGNTPLHRACYERDVSLMIELLENPVVDSKITNNEGLSVFDIAVSRNIASIAHRAANVEGMPISSNLENLLFLIKNFEPKDIDAITKIIREKPELLYEQDANGNSPLSIIVEKNNLTLLDLIKNHIDIEKIKPNGNGDSLLHLAARNRNLAFMEFLVENGMSITEKNISNETPLECLLMRFFTLEFAKSTQVMSLLTSLNQELLKEKTSLDRETAFLEAADKDVDLKEYKQNIERLQKNVTKLEKDINDLNSLLEKGESEEFSAAALNQFLGKVLGMSITVELDGNIQALNDLSNIFSEKSLDQLIKASKNNGKNPLEIAVIFNSAKLLKMIESKLSPKEFEEYLIKIEEKSPGSTNALKEESEETVEIEGEDFAKRVFESNTYKEFQVAVQVELRNVQTLNEYSQEVIKILENKFQIDNQNVPDEFLRELETKKNDFLQKVSGSSKEIAEDFEQYKRDLFIELHDQFLKFIFEDKKAEIIRNLPDNLIEKLEKNPDTLNSLFKEYRDKQIAFLREKEISLDSMDEFLSKEIEKCKEWMANFEILRYDDTYLYLDPALKNLMGDLYLETGICYGGALVIASKKVNDQQEKLVQPDSRSRMTQASHDVGDIVIEKSKKLVIEKSEKLGVKQTGDLVKETEALLSAKNFKEYSTDEKCGLIIDALLQFSKSLNDFNLYRRILKQKKESGYTDDDLSNLQAEIDKVMRKKTAAGGEVDINILKNLKMGLNNIENSTVDIEEFIKNPELTLSKLDINKSSHFIMTMSGSSGAAHAVYLHLSSPYELQDVNRPGVTLKTEDLHQFKMYLFNYFLIDAPAHDYQQVSFEQVLRREP